MQAVGGNNIEKSSVASGLTLEEMERQYILSTLGRESGDKARAAKVLGIDLSTLYRKLNRYGSARNQE